MSPSPCIPTDSPPRSWSRSSGRSAIGSWVTSLRRARRSSRGLGEAHLATGDPIVYTSGDSVFQIACHKAVVPLDRLYEWCRSRGNCWCPRIALAGSSLGRSKANRGRSSAAPSDATSPCRRPAPPCSTPQAAAVPVYGVGKIQDIFDRQGITEACYSDSNDHGVDLTIEYLGRPAPSFVFTNLVDFDSKYGHRNDPTGYAAAVEALDRRLPELIEALDGGVMLITGNHGCDPPTPPTDHSRELTPLLAAGLAWRSVPDRHPRRLSAISASPSPSCWVWRREA